MKSFLRGSISTPVLSPPPHHNTSDGEDNQSSASSSFSPYGDSEGGFASSFTSNSSSSFDERRLLGIAEESPERRDFEFDPLTVTERDIFAIKSCFNGYKCHVYSSSTLANLYFSPNTKTGTIRPNRWKLMFTGIPVLVLDSGETKSRMKRRINIYIVEKGTCFTLWSDVIDNLSRYSRQDNFHTLYYSQDHSLRVGLSFDNQEDADEFYSRVCSLTENPRNIALSSPASKKSLSSVNTAHYFNGYNKERKKPSRPLISSPCGFNHIVSVHREDVDRYYSLQSLVDNLPGGESQTFLSEQGTLGFGEEIQLESSTSLPFSESPRISGNAPERTSRKKRRAPKCPESALENTKL
eukprot:TRINITY_DN1176_c1_g1_i1.p1 TRINITY_DN1176_c1_g1~~TRINITY_DN1176_c1_g1_i1.p1  ORF type:complete len:378 (-),score=74.55 TRINITY_DN1176_c1_g1_i1:1064-2122(-)